MEKIISPEERIRRAEEIYARRKSANSDFRETSYARVNVGEKRKKSPIKKMLIQIFICIVIYITFFTIQSGEYSGQLNDKIKSILEYDITFQNVSDNIINYINQIKNANATIPEENKEQENKETEPETLTEATETMQTETLGITDEPVYIEEVSSISQEEIDSNYIKENYTLIKPLIGTITSRFGNRNPTNKAVPKYHTGIDIAGEIGTKIVAAMEGEVTLVSSSGDYRKPCKNSKWRSKHNVCTLQ